MQEKLNILLAEDDENLGMLLHSYLQSKGFQVLLARNGKIAYEKFNGNKIKFDFLILDVMMPEMDGFTLAKEIREIDKNIPILFLTAKSMKEDKLQGFARINAILKRSKVTAKDMNQTWYIGKIKYEPELSILHLEEGNKRLTTKENHLLSLLVKNKGEILDRQATLRAIWGDDNYFNGRSMDVYIAKLRKLLKEDHRIEIMNIHGVGFKFIVKN